MLEIPKGVDLNLKEIYGISQRDEQKRYFADIWEEKYPILNNNDVKAWLSKCLDKFKNKGKPKNKFSITTYLSPLQQYCNYYEVKNPSNLLREEIDDRNKRVMDYLYYLLNVKQNDPDLNKIGFRILKKTGETKIPNKVSVINMIQSRIKSFYSARGSNISDGIESEDEGLNNDEMIFDKGKIKKLIFKVISPRYKLAIKLQTQLGLRVSDILEELTSGKYSIKLFKHPKYPNDNSKYRYYIKNFETIKEKVTIKHLFFTEELTDAFKTVYNIEDLTKFPLNEILKTKTGKPMNSTDYLIRLKKAGKDLKFQENIKTHCLRKYFSTQIYNCDKIDNNFREHLMGHKPVNKLTKTYVKDLSNPVKFYEKWNNIEETISIDYIVQTEIIDNTDEDVIELRKKNLTLRKQMDIVLEDNEAIKEQLKTQEQYRNSLSE